MLTGRLLTLRELSRADADDLCTVYGDQKTVEHLSFSPRTWDQCVALIDSAMKDAETEPRRVYMLAAAKDGHLVGTARLALDERPHSAQIGFALHHGLWGQGLGTELLHLLLRLGFDTLRLARIWGARSPDNAASAAVMNSAGMIEEGRIRRHLWTGEAWRDSIAHSILSDEWSPPAPKPTAEQTHGKSCASPEIPDTEPG
ncbi:GNAT family N-acetyltransferase [Allosalinactinospora lopnorensis]|uniref:GNAT family N-acetyltransferase n=1 Tax=Allosalinactinospora lopnorensis TaxID=1352348 RepID=UPI001F389B4A|nr:GNAT family N-acetyltransferase [Allosalinactinospora lopnorensis]